MGKKCPKCQTDNPDTQKFCGGCGTSLPPDISAEAAGPTITLETAREELKTGSTFVGRYQIIEELGKGGMGKVYRVVDKKLEEEVALKLIKPEIASDKSTIERFKNELKLARKISHRNVGRMYELMEEQGVHFITMEYVPGGDLRRFIRRSKQLNIGTAISIAKQICEGLTEAHQYGVVHRDLKPSNILIDDDGNARILDFGIARSLKEKGITGSGMIIGTPEYMSPEQVEAKEGDQRSDLYSLGIILYEMTTGRLPFEADTPFAVGIKQKGEAPQDPRILNPQIPEGLSRVILKCLEKDRDNRYRSAGEVRTELEQIEKGLPTTAPSASRKKPVTSREITVALPSKKVLVPILLFVVFVALAMGVWLVFLKGKGTNLEGKMPSIAVLPFEDQSLLKDQAHICAGMTGEIINKLSQLGKFDVRSRFLVKEFDGTGKSLQAIGEELSVDFVLFGGIHFEKEDVRVDAELVRVADSKTLWTDNYLRKSDDIFSIQSQIAEQIAGALKMKLTPEEKTGLEKNYTENIEAYKLYLQGRFFYDKRSAEGYEKAIEYYRQAIDLDPEYALAYSGLADVYMSQSEVMETAEEAREAARKALELDDTLAEACTSQAIIKLFIDWDFKGAEEDFKKALDLDPNYATAHHWYSMVLTRIGQHARAIMEMERAMELNPTDPSINRNYVWALICDRQNEKAVEQARKTYNNDPDFLLNKDVLTVAYLAKSMFQEILELYEYDEKNDYVMLVHLLEMAKNNREEAVKIFDGLADTHGGFRAAYVYALLGEADSVFEHLDRAFKNHQFDLTLINVMPVFDDYHSDPRFEALLKKMGLD
jgi:TolB-like protein/Tfp pilus assembly protein PilF